MGTGRLRRAPLAAVALAAVLFIAGCDQDKPGPLDRPTTTPAASPEPTVSRPVVDLPDDLVPSSADPTGGIPVSDDGVGVAGDGDVVVDVYFDFMCPYCGTLDQVNATDLDELVAEGGVTVVYHPVSILNRFSEGTDYSTRAVNAVAVVADLEPEHVPAFVTALLAEGTQPQENTPGLSDTQIAQIAQDVGVSPAVTDQFTATMDYEGETVRTFVPWTAAVSILLPVTPNGTQGTPSLLVDNEWFAQDWRQPGILRAGIEAVKG